MKPYEVTCSYCSIVKILHGQTAARVQELEQAIRDHKKMVAASRRYNIFLHDEAHKDLWSKVNDDISTSNQCD